VTRRIALAGALAVLAALAVVPAAFAQGPVIQAVDDLSGANNRWEPPAVAVPVGGTVTWRYDGTQLTHNVKSTSANWNVDTQGSTTDPQPVSYTFAAEGTYTFLCKYHGTSMSGTVTVGNPPPPPPPPLSEQPWPNDQQAPPVLDVADTKRPRLSGVRAAAVRNGARVRFRLSERARVTVRFKLGGLTVKTAHRSFRAGTRSLIVRDRRMRGRYRVEIVAADLADNHSRVKHARVTVG
jgi:plastocyanin